MNDERQDILRKLIRDVPDFPKPGVIFKDITTLLKEPQGLAIAVDLLAEQLEGRNLEQVVAIESRGFLFGASLALRLGTGLIPVRKPGKLPADTERETYDLEYGTDTLEIHRDAIEPGVRVVVVDDVLATGGTAEATVRMLKRLGAEVDSVAFVIELDFLGGRAKLGDLEIVTLLHY